MSRKSGKLGKSRRATRGPKGRADLRAPKARSGGWAWLVGGVLTVALAVGSAILFRGSPAVPPPPPPPAAAAPAAQPEFVGASTCAQCHGEQTKLWRGSHHDLAMQVASEASVLGDFADAKFAHFGVESTFFRRGGKFMVRTEDADGKLADFEVKYAFGVVPLQQYLVEFSGGRLQALTIAWDSRPKAAGGQRWFHLYPDEKIAPHDQLHWTGLYQNWNLQCAECHSTNVRKGFDAATGSYRTTFSELNVACEACHGPGSRHVAWAREPRGTRESRTDNGLQVRLRSDWESSWRFVEGGGPIAQRGTPPAAALGNVCAACHARRSTHAEGGAPGAPLEDTHRLSMLTAPNYHADGQQREEVYTWGSFLQSRMFQRGVTCVDCHEPHSLKLRLDGNATCGRCHAPATFDTPRHHFHKAGLPGAQCVDCHMPAQTYMGVDDRRDHSFRTPRPDVAAAVGAPDACTGCHVGKDSAWAGAAMDGWYGATWRERPQHGATLHAAATQGARALPSLMELARDPSRPAIVRATAATAAQPHMRADMLPLARALLHDADANVRIAALGLLEVFPPAVRREAAGGLLSDPIRGVRMEAGRLLADVPDAGFPPEQRIARDKALAEHVEALKLDADWPAANANLGNLRLRQGRLFDAFLAFREASKRDPRFVGAYVGMADVHRREGRDPDGEKVLRQGLAMAPGAADLHHALGLTLVRMGDRDGALRELAAATDHAPGNPRYAYVHAVALNSFGRRDEALAALAAADARHPGDRDILGALISIHRERGATAEALTFARKLLQTQPDDPGLRRLVQDLERAR